MRSEGPITVVMRKEKSNLRTGAVRPGSGLGPCPRLPPVPACPGLGRPRQPSCWKPGSCGVPRRGLLCGWGWGVCPSHRAQGSDSRHPLPLSSFLCSEGVPVLRCSGHAPRPHLMPLQSLPSTENEAQARSCGLRSSLPAPPVLTSPWAAACPPGGPPAAPGRSGLW